MSAKLKIGLIAGALFVAAGWFFVSPLFIDRVVDEPLPGSATIPTTADVRAMPPAVREATMNELMEQAARSDRAVDESMDMQSKPVQVANGTFADADVVHKGSGRALVYRLPDGSHVLRFEDFRVTNGPALVVLLARAPDPASAADVSAAYLKLDDLKGNIGNQNYAIPASVDVTSFGSVVIWCDLFDVLFSAAPLTRL